MKKGTLGAQLLAAYNYKPHMYVAPGALFLSCDMGCRSSNATNFTSAVGAAFCTQSDAKCTFKHVTCSIPFGSVGRLVWIAIFCWYNLKGCLQRWSRLKLTQRNCMGSSKHGTDIQILLAVIFCYVILALRCAVFATRFATALLIE